MAYYLHFGFKDEPRQTVEVECIETECPRNPYAMGYGPKIPTQYKVKWNGRWRRVYAAQFANAASLYIGKPGKWLATFSD